MGRLDCKQGREPSPFGLPSEMSSLRRSLVNSVKFAAGSCLGCIRHIAVAVKGLKFSYHLFFPEEGLLQESLRLLGEKL